MAGHHKGQPRRDQARQQRMNRRLATSTSAEGQLAAAFDMFRSAVRNAPAADRPGLARHAAEFLAALAAEVNGRTR